jgi:tripeptidyl-peptidase-1
MLSLFAAAPSALVTSVAPESFSQMGWARLRTSNPTEEVSFTISLKQRNIPELKRRALAASTPGSAEYGKYMSTQEIDALTSPSAATKKLITAWLLEHDVTRFNMVRENVFVKTNVQKASALLGTTFSSYQKEGRTLVRAADYTLPDSVAAVTATTLGLHGLPMPRMEPINMTRVGPNPTEPPPVTPSVIAATYKIDHPYINRFGSLHQGVAEFQGQYMSKTDLVDFFQAEVPGFKGSEDKVKEFIGVPYKKGTGVEADLDIQFIMGVSPGVKTDFFEWPEMDFCSDLHAYTAALLDSDSSVNSISYGWQGDLKQLNCKAADINVTDVNWAKLAAKGTSVMISSGDSGSGYTPVHSEGGAEKFKLYPSWPASSPWVTAVGATCFVDQVGSEEMATLQFGSGGGFSTDFDQTDAQWQKDAVAKYVALGTSTPLAKFPPADAFDPNGRATPDVSALGEGFQVYVNGRVTSVGGTSASSPTFAGIVSLLNEARVKEGKATMGFLNPFLYANPDAFTDVVKGTNAEGRGPFASPYGFAAAPGWDAATGLGTPLFDKLLDAAMKAAGASSAVVEAA